MMSKSRHENVWHNYQCSAAARGDLVCRLLQQYLPLSGKDILDIGCGYGGTAVAMAKSGARVTAIDIDGQRLQPLREQVKLSQLSIIVRHIAVEKLPLHKQYHAMVLWDVLEHLPSPERLLQRLYHILKPHGLICIATPNRLSPFNMLCDPHYGLPGVALFPRRLVKKIIADYFGWHRREKPDFPQLYSLHRLSSMLQSAGFRWRLIHRAGIRLALQHPEAMWSRPWHLWVFNKIKRMNGEKFITCLISDNKNLINYFLQPTFFILGQKI